VIVKILRAAFWITVVLLFIPREPDIGYDGADALSVAPPKVVAFLAQMLNIPPCAEHAQCTADLSLMSDFRQAVRSHLERARAELKENPLKPLMRKPENLDPARQRALSSAPQDREHVRQVHRLATRPSGGHAKSTPQTKITTVMLATLPAHPVQKSRIMRRVGVWRGGVRSDLSVFHLFRLAVPHEFDRDFRFHTPLIEQVMR